MTSDSRQRAIVLVFGLVAGMGWSGRAQAGEPRLDRLAAERGIEVGALELGSVVVMPPPSRARPITVERRSLTLHGLPIRGAFETTWQQQDGPNQASPGPVQVMAARYPSTDADVRPEHARIDVAAARASFSSRLQPEQLERAGGLAGLGGELVYLLVLERPMLAWEFTAPMHLGSVGARASRERVWVSAVSGQVLDAVELIDFDNQAEVYEVNPQHTPAPSLVTLANLDPEPEPWEEGQTTEPGSLTGTRVRVFNCIEQADGPYATWHSEGECFPTQRVRADSQGDYFVPLPNVSLIDDNRDPNDLYAELSMYWHAEKFFAFMSELGVDEFPCELSNMVANFHWLEPSPGYPELAFGPYNNAYFSGACEIADGPTMLFGQGASVDFAFDGDVVYHELGHGIVAQLTPEGLRQHALRPEGVLMDARALNEAIADYHTLMITERPEMAEYVGFYWPQLDDGWIRHAENDTQCPRDMAGQPHNDSAPFTAALWAARRRVGGAKLDPVVIASLPLLAGDATLESASAALLQVAAAERDAGVWTTWDYDQLERALAARNLLDCKRVVDDPASLDEPRFLYLRNNGNSVSPFWPGPVQYRQVVAPGTDNLLVTFEVSTEGNSDGQPVRHDVVPWLLVKRSSLSADASIEFTYEMAALGHHDDEDGDINQAWEIAGDWDEIYAPTELGEARRQFLIRALEPGEAVHMSFVNTERQTIVIRELQFASVASEDLDEGSPLAEGEPDIEIDDGGACACTSRPARDTGGALGLGMLMLLALGRRRSRER
jgi:MYXO-CTERM domain-containing protein